MGKNDLLVMVAAVVLILALVNLGITINKVGNIKSLTGYATDAGTANLTIESGAVLNFTMDFINWGSGVVNASFPQATVNSEGNLTNGNWTNVTQGLNLRNDGNCNITFTLTTSNVAAGFIGGSGTSYKLKLSDNESNACFGVNGLNTYTEATGGAQAACTNFGYNNTMDLLDIDVQLIIPSDASPGAKTSLITATGNCI